MFIDINLEIKVFFDIQNKLKICAKSYSQYNNATMLKVGYKFEKIKYNFLTNHSLTFKLINNFLITNNKKRNALIFKSIKKCLSMILR